MLKILVVNDVFPNTNNRTTILLKNITEELSKKIEIKIYWIITDEHNRKYKETNPNYEILFLSDFNNAVEVLEKIKPDISYHMIGFNIIQTSSLIVMYIVWPICYFINSSWFLCIFFNFCFDDTMILYYNKNVPKDVIPECLSNWT